MAGLEQVSSLIGDIYDAALDPALWPGVLHTTCDFVGGCAASLLSQHSSSLSAQFYYSWGTDPRYTKLYQEKYIKINPGLVFILMSAEPGQIASMLDVIPRDEYLRSKFFKEWVQPQGYLDAVHVVLEKSAFAYAGVAVVRNERQGFVDEEVRRQMRLVAPHFCRAVAIGKVIDLHKVEAAALADTLDGITAALFLIDAARRVIHANVSGQQMLREGRILRTVAGALKACDEKSDQSLQDLLAAVSTEGSSQASRVMVPLDAPNDGPHIAHLLPLTTGARRKASIAYSAVAAVFVRKAELDLPHPLEALASHYQLTSTELRVLIGVVQIGGVPEIADAFGVSRATVKTHLSRLFDKTGTSRQADLVKIVTGFASPLMA
jgi:DNA-binding CsgD family transcriptional regulator